MKKYFFTIVILSLVVIGTFGITAKTLAANFSDPHSVCGYNSMGGGIYDYSNPFCVSMPGWAQNICGEVDAAGCPRRVDDFEQADCPGAGNDPHRECVRDVDSFTAPSTCALVYSQGQDCGVDVCSSDANCNGGSGTICRLNGSGNALTGKCEQSADPNDRCDLTKCEGGFGTTCDAVSKKCVGANNNTSQCDPVQCAAGGVTTCNSFNPAPLGKCNKLNSPCSNGQTCSPYNENNPAQSCTCSANTCAPAGQGLSECTPATQAADCAGSPNGPVCNATGAPDCKCAQSINTCSENACPTGPCNTSAGQTCNLNTCQCQTTPNTCAPAGLQGSECTPATATNDCGAGKYCNTLLQPACKCAQIINNNTCSMSAPGAECVQDSDCGGGGRTCSTLTAPSCKCTQIINPNNCSMSAPDAECVEDADCGTGKTCSTLTAPSCKCTQTITHTGTLIIKKVANGPDDTFYFNAEPQSEDGAGHSTQIDAVDGVGETQFTLAEDYYDLSEDLPEGWEFAYVQCNDGNSSGPDPANNGIKNVAIAADSTVTCTFTNNFIGGGLKIIKVSEGGSDVFTFSISPGTSEIHKINTHLDETTGQYVGEEDVLLEEGTYDIEEVDYDEEKWSAKADPDTEPNYPQFTFCAMPDDSGEMVKVGTPDWENGFIENVPVQANVTTTCLFTDVKNQTSDSGGGGGRGGAPSFPEHDKSYNPEDAL